MLKKVIIIALIAAVAIWLENKKKSIAFRIIYQSDERTLKDEEVVEIEKKFLGKLKEKTGARLRK